MRTFTRTLASSVFFGSSTQAISTSASTGQFNYLNNGPQQVVYTDAFCLSGHFGGNGNPSSGFFGGKFNLLAGNANEVSTMVVAASAIVSTTGAYMFNITGGSFKFCDFQFIPSSASTSGFLTVLFVSKGKE